MNKITGNHLKITSVIIGFIATLMIVFPALSTSGSNDSYTGLQVVFGHEFIDFGGFGSGEIKFSFINLIAYSLPLIAALVLLFTKANRLTSTILFGVAAVLLFLVIEFTVVTVTILGSVNVIDVEWRYAIGLIIAASLSIIGCAIGAFSVYKKV